MGCIGPAHLPKENHVVTCLDCATPQKIPATTHFWRASPCRYDFVLTLTLLPLASTI
jgi:hypothetical protein